MGRAHAPVELRRPSSGGRAAAVRRRSRPRVGSLRATVRAGPLGALLLVFLQVLDPVHGAYSAQTVNGSNDLSSAVHYTCNNAVMDIGAAGVLGSAPANRYYKLAETSGPTAADSSGAGASGTYYGGVTYGATGPCLRDGARAVTLNGSTGYVGTSTGVSAPSVFSLEVWFRTATTSGGMIMNLANRTSGASVAAGNSADPDRGLYMSDTGRLAFTVRSGVNATGSTTTGSYNDNAWHMATVTFSGTNGTRLYVDGALVASNTGMTTANSYTGYWRIGYDTVPGSWPLGPTSPYFGGSVAHASVYGAELTAQQISDHYKART